jgi:two-component system, NarL family, response regulator NreC
MICFHLKNTVFFSIFSLYFKKNTVNNRMIRILLVEDHPLFRSGIKTSLLNHEDISIIGEADNEVDAIELVKKESPDLVLMDITLKGSNGIEATQKILSFNSLIKVIILSSSTDLQNIKRAITAGAKGFMPKDIPDDKLIIAIRTVINNKLYFDQSISDSFITEYAAEQQNCSKPIDVLFNSVEKEVFFYLMSGVGIKEMASKMKVSIAYLSKIRNIIFEKAGVNSLVELALFAVREGFIQL